MKGYYVKKSYNSILKNDDNLHIILNN